MDIEKCLENKNCVTVYRELIDAYSIRGYLLDAGRELVLMQSVYDFSLDGFRLLRRRDITDIVYDAAEQFLEYIQVQEGIANAVGCPYALALDDWKDAFESWRTQQRNLIIEVESHDDDMERMMIGRIVDVTTDAVILHGFDATGQWDEKPTRMSCRDITTVSLDTRYCNILSKYVGNGPAETT